MIYPRKFLVFAAAGVAFLLDQTAKVDACSCRGHRTVSEYAEAADVVLRATALSSTRLEQVDINDKVHFTVDIVTIYKGDGVQDLEELTFATGGNDALCGVDLTIGQDYLIGLYKYGDNELNAQSCGLFRVWRSLAKEEKAALRTWDETSAECNGSCGEFQECLQFRENEAWYCSDNCEENMCPDGERCVSRKARWCRRSKFKGCPRERRCSSKKRAPVVEPTADPCKGRCSELQECVFYTGVYAEDQYYCSAVCDPSPCEDDEECTITPTICVAGSICSNGFTCLGRID